MQYIIRKGTFDSGHRVMNEKFKCFNIHGHTYLYELKFGFTEMEDIGYAIDFKEIKRIACQWIDDYLDHGIILNPHDVLLLSTAINLKSKYWLMSLNGTNKYCNPSVENIAKEIFVIIDLLFRSLPIKDNLRLTEIILYETPNCYTICNHVSTIEYNNVRQEHANMIDDYLTEKGFVEYDDRKI